MKRHPNSGARSLPVAALMWLVGTACVHAGEPPAEFQAAGERALEHTRRVVSLGPRHPGTENHRKQQQLILAELAKHDCQVREENFTASTPIGPVPMKNITARFPGRSKRVVVISGHYDTYTALGRHFVGANDAGSSAGFLLEMANLLSGRELEDEVWLIFFDGEEAIVEWSGQDHTYGSRRIAELWELSGIKNRIKAIINVDMIGDADLRLAYEGNSTPWLRDLARSTGRRLGYVREFPLTQPQYVEDDHVEFTSRGMPAVNLIDFDYGLFNRHWHTTQDTLDKLSARSFAVMLHVVSELVSELEKRP